VIVPAEFPLETINPSGAVQYAAACPAGSRPVGGGFETAPNGTQLTPAASHPLTNTVTGVRGWRVQLRNNTSTAITTLVRVHAICATVR